MPDAADVVGEAALRAAFAHLDLSSRMTYAQAMANPLHALCVRNYALALARKRNAP